MADIVPNSLTRYPGWEATIGIEVHVQLNTHSKIFCSCPVNFGQEPNTTICPICVGHPGTLPVLNKAVVESAIMAGVATGCTISRVSEFARKHYMYPDLPKNYQITQGEIAICMNGGIPTETIEGAEKRIGIFRIHMEEDAGKSMHMPHGKSYVDLNRAGTPLLEIVSAPDIANAHEAKGYLSNLRLIMQYLGISDVNMEEGSFRADINISVKRVSDTKLGTRAEVKNVNSFKFIGQAINYEIERQIELIESGERVKQETRLWNEKDQKTIRMREKGDADDYRYFTEPDIPPVVIDDAWYARVVSRIPELPLAKKVRFMTAYALSAYDADLLVQEPALAHYFEEVLSTGASPKLSANWILRDVLGLLKEHKLTLASCPVTPALLGELVRALDANEINSKVAQDVFAEMAQTGKGARAIIAEKGLGQVSDVGALRSVCEAIVAANAESVAKYRAGDTRVFGFFVGQAMKATGGKGNPKLLTEIFTALLA